MYFYLHLKMTLERLKRRNFLLLIFIAKPIRILQKPCLLLYSITCWITVIVKFSCTCKYTVSFMFEALQLLTISWCTYKWFSRVYSNLIEASTYNFLLKCFVFPSLSLLEMAIMHSDGKTIFLLQKWRKQNSPYGRRGLGISHLAVFIFRSEK